MLIKEGPVAREKGPNSVDTSSYIYLLNDCKFLLEKNS
jgi:hypothetical protein